VTEEIEAGSLNQRPDTYVTSSATQFDDVTGSAESAFFSNLLVLLVQIGN